MKAKFQHKCDSIETVLRGQIPAKTDSIWTKDSAMIGFRGESYKWRTSVIKTTHDLKWHFTCLRPILLRARPKIEGEPVGLLYPGCGSQTAIREFSYVHSSRFGSKGNDPPSVGTRTDSVTAILNPKDSLPYDYVLLADSVGKPLGWADWDSLVVFKDSATAAQAIPFYRDGLADLLDGVWVEDPASSSRKAPLFEGISASKSNPEAYFGRVEVFRLNLRRHLWSNLTYSWESAHDAAEMDAQARKAQQEQPEFAKQYYSQAIHPKTGKKYWYMDPRKVASAKVIPLHWYGETDVSNIQPLTSDPTKGRSVSVRLGQISAFSKPALVLEFNPNNEHGGGQPRELVMELPLRDSSHWQLVEPGTNPATKRNVEFQW
jgi:hypothetical protein